MSTPMCTSAISRENEREQATARLQGRHERARAKTIQVECVGSMHGNLYMVSLTRDKAGYE